MAKIKFLETRVVDDHRKGTKHEERFEEGKVYDLRGHSALRWVNRGVAEFVNDAERKAAEADLSGEAEGKRDRDAGGDAKVNDLRAQFKKEWDAREKQISEEIEALTKRAEGAEARVKELEAAAEAAKGGEKQK